MPSVQADLREADLSGAQLQRAQSQRAPRLMAPGLSGADLRFHRPAGALPCVAPICSGARLLGSEPARRPTSAGALLYP